MKRLLWMIAGIAIGVALTGVVLAYVSDGPIEAFVEYGKLLLEGLVVTLEAL